MARRTGAATVAMLLGVPWLAGTARAEHVTIELVTPAAGGALVPVEAREALWKSPLGGWGLVSWPFALFVDDEPILGYSTAEGAAMAASVAAPDGDSDRGLEEMLGKTFETKAEVNAQDLLAFEMGRRASQTVDVVQGAHTLKPFGIEFNVGPGGAVTCADPRVRVDAGARRLQVICHPVVIKSFDGSRSVAAPLRISLGSASLLGALDAVFADIDKKNADPEGTSRKAGFRRVELYVPASGSADRYDVNGVAFTVDAEGRVRLAADAKGAAADGREIRLTRAEAREPGAAGPATQLLGVSWAGAGNLNITCGATTVAGNPAGTDLEFKVRQKGAIKFKAGALQAKGGAVAVPVPAKGPADVSLGGLAVRVPAATDEWPHRQLVYDTAAGAVCCIQTAAIEAKPAASWSCRVMVLAGKPAIPETLRAVLEPVAGGAAGGEVELKGAAGVFTGALPARPGFWRLRVTGDDAGALKGQALGLALIGDRAQAGVSLFTVKNRALFRRGATFDLLWVARRAAGAQAAEWPVRLRGTALDTVIGTIAVPAAGADAASRTGRLVVDTTALGPGEYSAAVEADGVAGYPFRFRICQKEQRSDFSIYSFFPVVEPFMPYPDSPLNAYIDFMPGGPGLVPFLKDGDGSLGGDLAGYATAPFGPAPESFERPGMEERNFMALAAMGLHTAPPYPTIMPAEDANPQHTLPENLQNLRRRMALYIQQRADYPGLDGFAFGWYATTRGFWEYLTRQDGWQDRRNGMIDPLAWQRLQKGMAKFPTNTYSRGQVQALDKWQAARAWSATLPLSFHEWLADLRQIRPEFTMHNHKPTDWLGGGEQYPPMTYDGMSHRSALDYHDYCNPPGCEWRTPAFLGMGNQARQKTEFSVLSHGNRSEVVPLLFGSAGRGIDGVSLPLNEATEATFRIFERFGSMFTARDPLPDVAVYWTGEHGMASTVLYDLGRMRRPGLLVSPEDILAGELSKYKVLLLAGTQAFPTPEIEAAVRAFEAKGGVILKDDACAGGMPGRSIGFAYTGERVFSGPWGLGGDIEWVHVHPWWKFTSANADGKEPLLIKAFADTPRLPVTTPDAGILISPLGGKDSIVCFVWNKTEIPLEVKGEWRASYVMPRLGEMTVEKGWYVHNLLTGKPAQVENTAKGLRVPLNFTGFEGGAYLLTRREPRGMAIRTERTAPSNLKLTGWLADGSDQPLADPMPFEVTLKGPDGATLFRKFAALGPETALDVPVPVMAADAKLELAVRDLVLGSTAVQAVAPAAPAGVAARVSADWVGGEKPILEFLSQRKGPVTILLDEGQAGFRPAAEKMAALLKTSGREARVQPWDRADIRPLYLRWYPRKGDVAVANSLTNGTAWAWRIDLSFYALDTYKTFHHPAAGYSELGPTLRHEADVVVFGDGSNNLAVAQMEPYLRRTVTAAYPAPGGFFVHHVWSPFLAGYNALYVGCRDAAGAEAAVAGLASLKMPEPPAAAGADAKPQVVRGGAPAALEDLAARLGGTEVMGLGFAPAGKKLFVTTASYGEWFFVLDPATGEILEKRLPPVAQSFPNWWRYARWLTPVSETSVRIAMWNGTFLYDLNKGFLSKASPMPPHRLPRPGDGGGPSVSASTRLDDGKSGRSYLGGNDRIIAMDSQGRMLWCYEDAPASPDFHYPRGIFPRAVSGDGKVLVAGAFGVHDMLYGTAMKCPGVLGIDAATGKLLWKRDGMVLNAGKVVPLDDRFIVIDDNGVSHEIMAASGKAGTGLKALTGDADWVLQVPGRRTILIVENDHFSRQSRTCRAYLRALDGSGDKELAVAGRVRALGFLPDNQSFVVVTASDRVMRFSLDGALLWDTEVLNAGLQSFSPDSRTIALAGNDGVVTLVNAADGAVTRRVDLNFANNISNERFIKQERMGDVPQDKAQEPAPLPPAPSYLGAFDRGKVAFGPNLAPADTVRAKLKPAAADAFASAQPQYVGRMDEPLSLTVNVKAGETYLVECLNALADPDNARAGLRMEVSVTAEGQDGRNLPLLTSQPVSAGLARRRVAFRADGDGVATLRLRGVKSVTTGEGKNARTTIENAAGVLLGDLVVAAIQFPGRNLLFDGGPASRSQPLGSLVCTGYPHEDGNSNTDKTPFQRKDVALRLVNGVISNRGMGWAGGVDSATITVDFAKPRQLSAIVIHEDPDMPSSRYSLSVQNAGNGQWVSVGMVVDNTQGINIFQCPDFEIRAISYVWGGRFDGRFKGLGNSTAHMAQFEAYAAEDMMTVEELQDVKEDALPEL